MIASLHGMSLADARELLASIGYNPDWPLERLRAAIPDDMRERFVTALRVTAAAEHDAANRMEAGQ